MNSLLPNVGYLRKHPYRTCTPSFRKYTHLTSKLQEHTLRTMTKREKAEVSLTGEWDLCLLSVMS